MNKALMEIRAELVAPKNLRNKFGNYNYRSCESILEALKPLLKKYKASLTLTDEVVLIGDRFYVMASAIFAEGDDIEIATAYAREPDSKKGMDEPQITGTASSYARKYALNGLFLIDDVKDADTDEYHQQAYQQAEAEVIPLATEDEIRGLKDYAESLGVSEADITERFEVNSIYDLDKKQYASAIRMLNKTAEKKGARA